MGEGLALIDAEASGGTGWFRDTLAQFIEDAFIATSIQPDSRSELIGAVEHSASF